MLIPVFYFYVDIEVLRKSITSKYPFMNFFFENEPSMFGYDPELNNQLTVLYMFCIIALLVGIIVFLIIMYFNFIRLIKKNSGVLPEVTQQIQLLLFRILYIQILLMYGLLFSLFFLSILFTVIGIRYVFI